MSKLINISLAILLLISTIGVTVDKHYCEGHYVGTWFYAADDACGMGMPAENDCCNDDINIYSVENEFQFVSSIASPSLQFVAYVTLPNEADQRIIEDQFRNPHDWQSGLPPPISPKIYIKVQSFLI